MIVVDTNILIYAHRRGAAEHARARQAIEGLAASGEAWGIALASIGEFWGQVTHPRYPGGPSEAAVAAGYLNALQTSAGAIICGPGEGFATRLMRWAAQIGVAGVRIFDLQIALMAADNGAREIWSHDGGFCALPRMRVHDPL